MLAIGTNNHAPSGLCCSYRRSINDGNRLDDFLLVRLCARAIKVAHDGGHARLVAHSGSQMDLRLGVILGEAGSRGQQLLAHVHPEHCLVGGEFPIRVGE